MKMEEGFEMSNDFMVTISPDRDYYADPRDPGWQYECEELFHSIQARIGMEDIRMKPSIKDAGMQRSMDLFSLWTVALASIGGFKTLVELLKIWIDNKNKNKETITVKLKKGDLEIDISNATIERAISFYEELSDIEK
jgi:hypothetical protein